jgi:hypothetical protein
MELEIQTVVWDRHKYEAGLNRCMYCIVQYLISHTFKLNYCRHLRPSDFSYFTISLRNHQTNLCDYAFDVSLVIFEI